MELLQHYMAVSISPEQAFKELLSYTTMKVVETKMKLLHRLMKFLKRMSLTENELAVQNAVPGQVGSGLPRQGFLKQSDNSCRSDFEAVFLGHEG